MQISDFSSHDHMSVFVVFILKNQAKNRSSAPRLIGIFVILYNLPNNFVVTVLFPRAQFVNSISSLFAYSIFTIFEEKMIVFVYLLFHTFFFLFMLYNMLSLLFIMSKTYLFLLLYLLQLYACHTQVFFLSLYVLHVNSCYLSLIKNCTLVLVPPLLMVEKKKFVLKNEASSLS